MKRMMKQKRLHTIVLLIAECGLLMVACVAQVADAQQAVPAHAIAAPAVAASTARPISEDEAAAPAKPGEEGIKVHGHWVLVLKNPDGTVVERREFNNSLVTGGTTLSGDFIFAALLSGNASAGGMAIAFINGPTTTPGLDASTFCDIPTPGNVNPPAPPANINCYGFTTAGSVLAVTALTSSLVSKNQQTGLSSVVNYTPGVNIVLSGNYTVPAALGALGSISAVQTYAALCASNAVTGYSAYDAIALRQAGVAFQSNTYAPSTCNSTFNGAPLGESFLGTQTSFSVAGAFTSTNIAGGPLTVITGQIITVTVTLSFS